MTERLSHHGSLVVPGWEVAKNIAPAKDTEPASAISRQRRRVAIEASASTAGPLERPETAANRLVRTATASGQRRRKNTSTKLATPSVTSSIHSHSAWSSTIGSQPIALKPSMSRTRHVVPHAVTRGW
ncbi:hypothetical protein [Nocardioides anomalus]|uniref:hypothetical protein n=1 Tax=Nocardioides anomalus TaxID=2712223 RepID=UPI001E617488|nr:hypothetical protein [Nocardioides anomalus]